VTCRICQGLGHNRKEHYRPCGHCGKKLFFHALRLRDENEERASPTGYRYLCTECLKEGKHARAS
jgi:hypothetical protein